MEAKIVFITGASSGIGEGCARKFAKEGWNLILNARTVSKLEELKAELEATHGVRVYILPFDVRARVLPYREPPNASLPAVLLYSYRS